MRELERPPQDLAEYGRLQPYVVPGQYPEMEAAQPAVSPTHYLLVIWRQRWKIIAFVATCLLATYLISARMTPIYEATAKIDVDRRADTSVVGPESAQVSNGDDADSYLATQREIILSDAVVRPVAERYNLLQLESQFDRLGGENIRRKLGAPISLKQLEVNRPINTYLLDISYRSADPKLAADVANDIARSFLQHTFDIKVRSSGALTDYIEKELDGYKAKMEKSSADLAAFEKGMNVVNPEEKSSLTADRIKQLNEAYTAAQADRVKKEAAFNSLQNGGSAAEMNSPRAEELNVLRDRLNRAKSDLANVAAIYGPNAQQYRKAANEVNELERQIAEESKNVNARVDSEYREAINKEQMLAKEVANEKAELDKLNSHSGEYQTLKSAAENDRSMYNDLVKRVQVTGINSTFQNNSMRIADYARPPDSPVFPRTKLNLLLAFIGSLVLAI